jgi:hypothetical protein
MREKCPVGIFAGRPFDLKENSVIFLRLYTKIHGYYLG